MHLALARLAFMPPLGTPIDSAAAAIAFACAQFPLNAVVCTALSARLLTMPEHCDFCAASVQER